MLTPNIVILKQVTHYQVDSPNNALEVRNLVVASGTCNDVPFEATAINDPDFSTTLALFRADGGCFSRMEFQSVQRKIKMAPALETIDWRGDPEAKGYGYFHDQMCAKYHGLKVYLKVPFSRKGEAKGLGAEWDSTQRKWFVFTNSPNLREIEKYFRREEY